VKPSAKTRVTRRGTAARTGAPELVASSLVPRPKLRALAGLSVVVAWIAGACDCSGKGGARSGSTGQSASSNTTGTSSSSASGSSSTGTGGGPTGTRVRLVEANLSSGNNQTYDPGEGIRILTGIHGDVLLLQEFNFGTNSDTDLMGIAHTMCGMNCSYVRGPAAQIPNGIITSYPILSSGSWTDPFVANRTFVWAQIDVPGSKNLWAISVHLLTTDPTARSNEAAAIVSNITASIPAGDYIVLGGDLNTDSRMEPALAVVNCSSASLGESAQRRSSYRSRYSRNCG